MKEYRSGGGKGEDQNEFEEVSYFCILNLPTDLIHIIFSRLQVKFIARCKVVCRAWYNLVSVPDFMHHYYPKNKPFTTLVLSHYQRGITGRHVFSFVEISENGDDCTRTTIRPKLPFWPRQDSFLCMKGSCNGLLCLVLKAPSFEVIYIYNPISGESISLPEYAIKMYASSVYAFGFSPSTNKFKVLKLVPITMSNGERTQRCEIFTVGVDQRWRQLEYSFKVKYPGRRIALNGAVFWLDSTNIATFDFGEEKLGHISHPPGLLLNDRNMKLAVLNNRLCLLDCSIPSHYIIWTMEEYGVAESWTKIVMLNSCFPPDQPIFRHRPVAMLRNGNILFLLTRPGCLLSYSPKRKEFTVLEVPVDGGFIAYISEFAPLNLFA